MAAEHQAAALPLQIQGGPDAVIISAELHVVDAGVELGHELLHEVEHGSAGAALGSRETVRLVHGQIEGEPPIPLRFRRARVEAVGEALVCRRKARLESVGYVEAGRCAPSREHRTVGAEPPLPGVESIDAFA